MNEISNVLGYTLSIYALRINQMAKIKSFLTLL